MEFVDKCVKNVMPPASTMSETGTDVLFGSGKVAMISQGSWMVSAFKDNDYIKEHCDVARLPKDAETGESVSLYNGLGWAASANTDMPDEAFQLMAPEIITIPGTRQRWSMPEVSKFHM